MPATIADIEGVTHVEVPSLRFNGREEAATFSLVVVRPEVLESRAHILVAERGHVSRLTFRLGHQDVLVTTGHRRQPGNPDLWIHAADARVEAGVLRLTNPSWVRHPDREPADVSAHSRSARRSWLDALSFREERQDENGIVTAAGLRPPQVGALHALAAHWTVFDSPSLVVMPTGTGKTEVMIAAMVMRRPSRLLVLVPTDALRDQTVEKFGHLGVLPNTTALAKTCFPPVVARLRVAPTTRAICDALSRANVVVSTVAMLHRLSSAELTRFLESFDVVFFDEAHHVPAASWDEIHKTAKGIVVGFTATPFRTDGERIPGTMVYHFPLRLAQKQGYFRKITFLDVNEIDQEPSDRQIALKAIQQLRSDIAAGRPHLLLARAASRNRAEHLFETYYRVLAPDLSPVLIHSGTRGRQGVLQAIRAGAHRIIVCVDMFGEGFDLPRLKIAAMHDVHRSLAITLQFAGRFTRSGDNLGNATLVANTADPRVHEAIESLYAEDPDWNLLIPELSEKAIQEELDIRAFYDEMSKPDYSGTAFDLNLIRPKTSTVIYRAPRFNPDNVSKAIRSPSSLQQTWTNRARNLCVAVTRTHSRLEWTQTRDVRDELWDLYVLFFDAPRGLLFVHSSNNKGFSSGLVKAVAGQECELVSGERLFRAMHRLERLLFYNVGLYGRGRLRFRMYTGIDVADAIAAPDQFGATKSNIFAVGYENGRRTTIGMSLKGRLWAMTSSTIPAWQKWCQHVASKVLDNSIPPDGYLRYTLRPREIAALPGIAAFSVLVPEEWILGAQEELRIAIGPREFSVDEISFTDFSKPDNTTFLAHLALGDTTTIELRLNWANEQFRVTQIGGEPAFVRMGGHDEPLAAYLQSAPPVILLVDGSEVRGSKLLEYPANFPILFDNERVHAIDWGGVALTVESKWRNGARRDASIQGHLIDRLVAADNDFVFDDDDAGEAADVVEIAERGGEVAIALYHCKYSVGANPGMRVADVQVVCAQAVRSARWATSPARLLRHLERRNQERLRYGRPTRFEKGDLQNLRRLRRRIEKARCVLRVRVVQPGLSRAEMTPEIAAVFAAADMFIRQLTGSPLEVQGSA